MPPLRSRLIPRCYRIESGRLPASRTLPAMTSTTPRIITIALATLALAAPAANAMPLYEHDGAAPAKPRSTAHIQTSSLAGTVSGQDLRNPDQQAPLPPQTVQPKQDLRNPDQQAPGIQKVPAQQP